MYLIKLLSGSCSLLAPLTFGALLCCSDVIAQVTHPRLLPEPVQVEYVQGSVRLQDLCITRAASSTPEDIFAIDTLLEGIRAVARLADVHLAIAGDGELREEVGELGRLLLGERFQFRWGKISTVNLVIIFVVYSDVPKRKIIPTIRRKQTGLQPDADQP